MVVLTRGKAELKAFADGIFAAIPDFAVELSSRFTAGPWAGMEWTMSGTHRGDLPGLPMAKVIFVLQRRAGLTREQALAQWSGEQHVAIVGKLPGLTRYIQNHVDSAPAEPVCDGIGELWFATDDLMNEALNSPEMAAA